MPAWRWPLAQSPKGLLTAKPKFMTFSSVSQAMTLNTSYSSWHESFTTSGPRPKYVAFGHCIGFVPQSLASAVPLVAASTDPAMAMSCVTVSHRSWQKQREGDTFHSASCAYTTLPPEKLEDCLFSSNPLDHQSCGQKSQIIGCLFHVPGTS